MTPPPVSPSTPAPCALERVHFRLRFGRAEPPAAVRLLVPAGQAERLRGTLLELGMDAQIDAVHPAPPAANGRRGRVAALQEEHGPWAYAYAATVGARFLPRERWASDSADLQEFGLVVGDLLATSADELKALGCVRPGPGQGRTGFVQVEGGVGLRHLAKNLLAAAGALPQRRGRLVLAPGTGRSGVRRDGDDVYALGYLAPEQLAALVAAPHEALLLNTHANPFDALLGPTVFCALAGEGPGTAGHVATEPGDRVLPCFVGGGCVRAMQWGSTPHFSPVHDVAARHVLWLGCDLLLHRDSLYRSRRALFLQLLANPHTVSLTASLSKMMGDLDDLVAASCTLDAAPPLGQWCDEVVRRGAAGHGMVPELMVLGDPHLAVCAADAPGGCHDVAFDGEATFASPSLRSTVRLRGAVAGDAPVVHGAAVFGLAEPDGDGQVLRLVAFGRDGAAPPRLSVAPFPPDAGAWLAPCLGRLPFWRVLVCGMLETIERTHSSLADLHAQMRDALDGLGAWERDATRALAALRAPRRAALAATRATLARLDRLHAEAERVQLALLRTVLAFGARVDPRLEPRWQGSYVPIATSEPGERRCACGARCAVQRMELAVGGAFRLWVTCPRCGTVGDCDAAGGELRLRAGTHRDGLLDVVAQLPSPIGALPVALGATLRPEPGTDASVVVEAATFAGTGGECRLLLRGDPARVPSQQPLHVFAADSFALAHAVLWLEGAGMSRAGAGDARAADIANTADAAAALPFGSAG